MDLWIIKAILVFHFFLFQNVNSSTLLKWRMSLTEKTDNVLKHFINRFKSTYIEKHVPRQITMVGTSVEELQQVQPLMETYPYVICTETETFGYRSWFSSGNFVIIFLDDLNETMLKKNIDILSYCDDCKVLYIFKGIIRENNISLLFTLSIKKFGVNVQLVNFENNVIRIYGYIVTKNCAMKARLLGIWKPGVPLKIIDTWNFGSLDLNGCLITVSTSTYAPKMIAKELKNSSLIISGGLEGEVILALARKLNFTVKPTSPSTLDRMKYSEKSAILQEVATGKATIGIGRLRPTINTDSRISFSQAYDHDCVTWGVPRVTIKRDDVLWMEFTWQVWVAVLLVSIIICVIAKVCHTIASLTNGNRRNLEFVVVILDVFALHLGNPVVHVPTSLSGKFVIMIGLYYALVISSAYKTSLASILATENSLPAIVKSEEILKANLTVGGTSYNLDFLKDQANESETISKLIEKFVVINEPSEAMHRLKHDKKFACVFQRSALYYERYKLMAADEPIAFHIFKDCILDHQTVMVFRTKSPLREPTAYVIRRLAEAGLLLHWSTSVYYSEDAIERNLGTRNYSFRNMRNNFHHIFLLYSSCIFLYLIVFFGEIGKSIYDSKKSRIVSKSVWT